MLSQACGIIVLDGTGTIVECNSSATELFSHTLVGELWRDIISDKFAEDTPQDNIFTLKSGQALQCATCPLGNGPGQVIVLSPCVKHISVPLQNVIAEDKKTQSLLALAERVAQSEATVLLSGPSGAGKEVFAQYIHQHSARAKNDLIAINCAAIPENMLEATLFGYEKGAFTGAHKAHAGKFEQAQNSTLLLDEISEMDLNLQAKLLRVIQESEIERLGCHKVIQLNVRIIATTNRLLWDEVKAGRFREDLYYRLNVFPLEIPALKERPGDILPLAEFLLTKHARAKVSVSMCAKDKILSHSWPGNVREMDNVMQRALLISGTHEIDGHAIQFQRREPTPDLQNTKKQHEFEAIKQALTTYNGNRQRMAENLGISPRTLRYKLAQMREQGWM